MKEIDFLGAFADYMYELRDAGFGTNTELVVKPFRNYNYNKCICIEASMLTEKGKRYRTSATIDLTDGNYYNNAYISACINDVLERCKKIVSESDNDKVVQGYDGKTDLPLLHAVGGCERCWFEFYVHDDDVTEEKTRCSCPYCGLVQDKLIRKYTDEERMVKLWK